MPQNTSANSEPWLPLYPVGEKMGELYHQLGYIPLILALYAFPEHQQIERF